MGEDIKITKIIPNMEDIIKFTLTPLGLYWNGLTISFILGHFYNFLSNRDSFKSAPSFLKETVLYGKSYKSAKKYDDSSQKFWNKLPRIPKDWFYQYYVFS